MTARSFLVRGLLAGLLAGLFTFVVAHQVGEPHVEAAIGLEAAGAAASEADGHGEGVAAHGGEDHGDEGTTVSRGDQRTWGLLTGTVVVGTALGGLVALVAAGVVGRLGRIRPAQSTLLVALLGFVSVALVPFLKYPATPPAVGNAETIGERTNEYFGYLAISLLAAVVAVAVARALVPRLGGFEAVVAGVALYLVVVVGFGQLMPTVNEVGDFPADLLWYFRRASLITLATLWGSLAVILTFLVKRLDTSTSAVQARRDLAASL
ncbi:hypothetical protein ASD11_13680 [Aeromicrobium sp. Root495]|uniref:CbtA family protein n=1 Tax=Aeromicrobium sp. Root495 TaxID=1736550 RepID=UPI0006F5F135|nr:CbtA family protein [Aeromicrobium sp. Root495]KQY60491.1 hypothetical protein ASD11_13680 [Aeromicrobium sp. Root495]